MGLTVLAMQGTTLVDYSASVDRLELNTVAPGGFGALKVRLVLPQSRARVARPEFGVLNARLVVLDGRNCVYTGEVVQAALTLDTNGEGIDLVGQGGAGALADDPQDGSYTAATAQAIIAAEISRRSAYIAIDQDTSAILPSAPGATFSPVYDGATIEDILHELADLLGDYIWGVWDHPTHQDSFGLPTWQLTMHPRDTSTVGWQGLSGDVLAFRIAPASERMFNGVTLHYTDPKVGPGSVTVYDARLGAGQAQGTAPFRFRRFRRDMGRRVLTSAQAATLAAQYLAEFENVSNIIAVDLAQVRNAQGQIQPLVRVRADTNILLSEVLPRSANLPGMPAAVGGQNLFYIRQTRYVEQRGKPALLTLQLDQIADFAAADLTRLKYEEQLRQRSKRQPPAAQPVGMVLTGVCGGAATAAAGSQTFGQVVSFPTVMVNVPTSITLTQTGATNATAPTVADISVYGFLLTWKSSAAGYSAWIGTYQTVGN
jgi:hypothetical protein